MVWRKIGRILVVCGMLLVAFGASALPAQGAEQARPGDSPLLAPSPRPTLAPTSRPRNDSDPQPGSGRITGTIIDLTTGAPVQGAKVNIGGTVVASDANGNYDLWVTAGPYSVALVLNPEQGTPAQGQQMVDVAADATIVLHLSFHSPAAPTATPMAENAAAAPVASPAPAASAAPAAPVAARAGGGTNRPHAAPRLPRTSEESNGAWSWIALGALLLTGGIGLELGRKRLQMQLAGAAAFVARHAPGYENARLLASLLARNPHGPQPGQSRSSENDILLAALLTTDSGESDIDRQR